MGKPSAPSPDPRIGQAAMMSAGVGEDYLEFMQQQAAITNGWAQEDRDRNIEVFRPIQDQFIEDAVNYDSPERRATEARRAVADVRTQSALTRDATSRRMAAMGVDPRSGRYQATMQGNDLNESLAAAGAANTARRRVEGQGRAMRAEIVNLGEGSAVNPATSMGLSNNASSSGFSGAMRGYNQQGNLLNTQFQQQNQQWQNQMGVIGSIAGGAGTLLGLLSSKKAKTDKRPAPGVLDAVKKMPVEKWKYKDGMGDEGQHIGPYAEDFKKQTGLGDGKTISVVDALGVTMGAVKELAEKVDGLGVTRKRAA